MIVDDLSIFILRNILEKKEITTWQLAKSFNWSDKKNNLSLHHLNRFYNSKHMLLRKRIKAMVSEGIVGVEKCDGKNVFIVFVEKVFIKKIKFPHGKIKPSLYILDKSNLWTIYEINGTP